LVVEVADGDTIGVVLEGDPPTQSYEVRFLGIDAPPNAASVPWGVVAYEANRRLTSGKVVRLVRDQTDIDADGRLLRYVYLGDEMLNITLTEQGLARASIQEPDTRFQNEILEAEKWAKDNKQGLGTIADRHPTVSSPQRRSLPLLAALPPCDCRTGSHRYG
jgi:micrococcal nuclease